MPAKDENVALSEGFFRFARPIKSVAVIGAGPAGLAAARRLLEAGVAVTVLERKAKSGGTWVYQPERPPRPQFPSKEDARDNNSSNNNTRCGSDDEALRDHAPPGACYESLMNNIPTPLMRFPGCDYPPTTPWFVGHGVILDYLQDFSKHFGIEKLVRFNTQVLKAEKLVGDGRWQVATKTLENVGELKSTTSISIFDAVVVCTGRYDFPHIPAIPGLDQCFTALPSAFSHSKEYRTSASFRNKTVLILGSGSSGTDLTYSISGVCRRLYQSVHTSSLTPKTSTPTTALSPGEAKARYLHSLLPSGKVQQVPEVSSFTVSHSFTPSITASLTDGRTLTDIDEVIFCTGYRFSHPFLPSTSQHSTTEALGDLHLDIFTISDPTLAYVGVPCDIATFPFFDVQAMALAAVWGGKAQLPDGKAMRKAYTERKKNFTKEGKRGGEWHVMGVDREKEYTEGVLRWIGGDLEETAYGEQMEYARDNQVEVWIEAVRRRMRGE